MMDSPTNDRPQLTWIEVPRPDGGSRLEMRWGTAAPATPVTHAA